MPDPTPSLPPSARALRSALAAPARRANPPPRPRPFVPPHVDAEHDAEEVADFLSAMEAAAPLLRADDFDWRVVQKWQFFWKQITPDEQGHLRALGAWLRAQGWAEFPAALWRSVGVSGWAERWPKVPRAEQVRFALGFRSWADSPGMIDVFCKAPQCALYLWPLPPWEAVLLDGRSANGWLWEERPELAEALEEFGGHAGFDGGEFLVDVRRLAVVSSVRRPPRQNDDRVHFDLEVRAVGAGR